VAVTLYNSLYCKGHVVYATWFFVKSLKIIGFSLNFLFFDTKLSNYFLYF